jgi:transposase
MKATLRLDEEQAVVASVEMGPRGWAGLEFVAMDIWAPYIPSTRENVPDADRRIVFDKFHIAQHPGRAVDEVRRTENSFERETIVSRRRSTCGLRTLIG